MSGGQTRVGEIEEVRARVRAKNKALVSSKTRCNDLEDEGYDLALDLQEENSSFAVEEEKLAIYA